MRRNTRGKSIRMSQASANELARISGENAQGSLGIGSDE